MFNEALGNVKSMPMPVDFYRFKRVSKWLRGKSVLDVGCGAADFLRYISKEYQISGTEVNKTRVESCNEKLGQDAVKLGDLEAALEFEDNSFDTVTCLEVLEHLIDPKKALAELVRVSRKRVIITIPFDQKITYVLCIHCAKYTPHAGHLHSFNCDNISGFIPENAQIVKIELFMNSIFKLPFLKVITHRAPLFISALLDKLFNTLYPKANWMMVILDKNNIADK